MENNLVVNGELLLYGFVGDPWDGFQAVDVITALATLSGPLNVRINSYGGYTTDGVAIYNALKGYPGEVTVYVDAIAASAASVIAMAGNKIIMRKGSLMMIHDPLVVTMGNKADHEKSVELLEVTADSLASIYAARTGRPVEEIRAEMEEEIWLSPADAIAKGYADAEEGDAVEAAAFDYRIFAKAPEPLKALAVAKHWERSFRPTAAHAAQPKEKKDMTTNSGSGSAAPTPPVDAAAIESATMARVNAILETCNAAGEPAMAAALIREGVTAEQAKARVEGARDIRAAVARANKLNPAIDAKLADSYIASGASVEKVRADLFDKMAAADNLHPTNGYQPQQSGTTNGNAKAAELDPFNVYANRQKARLERGRAKGFVN